MADIRAQGYALLAPQDVASLAGVTAAQLEALQPAWEDLPPDEYLRDGGRYRSRRHASYHYQAGVLQDVPHRAHWQSLEYNALHGGMQRWFAPVTDSTRCLPAWEKLIVGVGKICDEIAGTRRWSVEAHQFRIDTGDGIGRPTPEGAHRDGVDFVAVFLLARQAIKGGETRVFEADGPAGRRFTLESPWSLLLMDDARVIHESTPIQPEQPGVLGYRDTLVLTYRAGGFQDEVPAA
ncbi:MAG: 2OG-Fe dioxygenase family protein [Pseudomonadota bacterium]|nr:2OG-Fe dioxygenase family protein [Pseudomonadota bacterium]